MICYNRDVEGRCLAYSGVECSENCSARIKTIEEKIALLNCLLKGAASKKEIRKLKQELMTARMVKYNLDGGKYSGWMSCYIADQHRGTGGGQSESDANAKTSMKQKMKDNRPVGVKPTKAQLQEYKEELQKWEAEHEKLERLSRTSMSHRKEDSYTGVPICFVDHGLGHCNGQRSSRGTLAKDCRECSYLWEENNV